MRGRPQETSPEQPTTLEDVLKGHTDEVIAFLASNCEVFENMCLDEDGNPVVTDAEQTIFRVRLDRSEANTRIE